MKKTTPIAIIVFMILLMAGTQTSKVAQANYFPPPSIEIFSPHPAPDANSNPNVTLNVRVNVLPNKPDITYICYSLDGKANVTLTNLTKEDNVYYWTTTKGVFAQGKAFSGEAFLGNLADGNHSLVVYAHYADGQEMSRSRAFTVDTNYTPWWKTSELLLLSPLNQTYTKSELPLTFSVNETVQSASYVLDNRGGNSSLIGNTTLTGLSEGIHKLTVTVMTKGGLASQSIFFTVAEETNGRQQPFQTALAIGAFGGSLAVIVVAALVYLKKRKN